MTLTIGSKNFPEQEILGEIYAQALEAAGYKVKTDLNLGSETVAPEKAVKSGQISGYPGVRQHGPDVASSASNRKKSPPMPTEAYEKAKAGIRKGRPDGVPADPVRQRQRGRDAEEDGRRTRPGRRSPTSKGSPKN